MPNPNGAESVPRAELYLLIEDPGSSHRRALENGARELSPLAARDWGHEAADYQGEAGVQGMAPVST